MNASLGLLFLAGGGTTSTEVADRFLDAAGRERLIVVVGQVRQDPARATSSRDFLIERGARFVVVWPWENPSDDDRLLAEQMLKQAGGVWIPGGDQNLVLDRFGTEWCRRVFREARQRGTSFFGTSAGAMLMSDQMISGYGARHELSEVRQGFGLIEAIVDTHYTERNRETRLRHALQITGAETGIGLDEGEWIVIHPDGTIKPGEGEASIIKHK